MPKPEPDLRGLTLRMVSIVLVVGAAAAVFRYVAAVQTPDILHAAASRAAPPPSDRPTSDPWAAAAQRLAEQQYAEQQAAEQAQAEEASATPGLPGEAAAPTMSEEDRMRLQAEQRLQYEQAQLQQALGASAPAPVLVPAGADRATRCEAAKAYRQSVLDQVGLQRDFDLLRRLDDMVYEACKT